MRIIACGVQTSFARAWPLSRLCGRTPAPSLCASSIAAVAGAKTLERCWLGGNANHLSAKELLKALCYREVMKDSEVPAHGMTTRIAKRLKKVGGGPVAAQGLRQIFARVDADPDWYPGKSYQEVHGPARVLTGQKRRALAECAMALKRRRWQPTLGRALANAPIAALNPGTEKPVSKQRVYRAFRGACCDEDPERPWHQAARRQTRALRPATISQRLAWAHEMQTSRAVAPGWCQRHVIWIDFCYSTLPRTEQQCEQQALAHKGKHGWYNPGCELASVTLAGDDKPR